MEIKSLLIKDTTKEEIDKEKLAKYEKAAEEIKKKGTAMRPNILF